MPPPVQPIFPALYLYPLNDSFFPKHISLAHGQRVKIGRQTNAKTAPNEKNGYFDSKVLSRQHAEVWEESGKIFIKDVKSSNGTFINGDRLSPEGLESDPNELKNDDIVEFGIDIVGDDNKTIIHHKVAARVVCVFTEQDVQVAARIEHINQHSVQQYQSSAPPGPSQQGSAQPNGAGSSFPFATGQQRRPQLAQQGLAGMGGMGGSLRPPGKSGLTFDHILSRLQGELQKSRETGSELHTLSGAMNEIHDTLGGNLVCSLHFYGSACLTITLQPPNLPSYPSALPPVRPSQPQSQEPSGAASSSVSPEQPAASPSSALTSSVLTDLQSKLHETQASLSTHVDKIRALEGVFAEQESIKSEVRALREMMESKRREAEAEGEHCVEPRGGFDEEEDEEAAAQDDSDVRSIRTIVPHELERVDEEDEEQLAAEAYNETQSASEEEHERDEHDRQIQLEREAQHEQAVLEDEEERRRRNDELGRPRTPEPTNLGFRNGDAFSSHLSTSKMAAAPRRTSPSSPLSKVAASSSCNDEALDRVLQQLGSLLALTSSLEAQHAAAQSTISALEGKVQALEATVKATQEAAAAAQAQALASVPVAPLPVPAAEDRESLMTMVMEWKKSMEGQWSSVREDWDKERDRLNQAREQLEGKVQSMDSGFEKLGVAAAALKVQQEQIELQQKEQLLALEQKEHAPLVNGDAKSHIGLVTPPSPRSLSSDSNRSRRKLRRGRSRQRSRSMSTGSGDDDTDATLASEEPGPFKPTSSLMGSLKAKVRQQDVYEGPEEEEDGDDTVLGVRSKNGAETLATPESSVYIPSKSINGSAVDDHVSSPKPVTRRERDLVRHSPSALCVSRAHSSPRSSFKPQ
ncbi:hypothetical protein C0993_006583 [Termitomyces sp. T159_Od127]|nr:hypothetical protein C0993_006583 [Termitomyces sp. T159_Od127]